MSKLHAHTTINSHTTVSIDVRGTYNVETDDRIAFVSSTSPMEECRKLIRDHHMLCYVPSKKPHVIRILTNRAIDDIVHLIDFRGVCHKEIVSSPSDSSEIAEAILCVVETKLFDHGWCRMAGGLVKGNPRSITIDDDEYTQFTYERDYPAFTLQVSVDTNFQATIIIQQWWIRAKFITTDDRYTQVLQTDIRPKYEPIPVYVMPNGTRAFIDRVRLVNDDENLTNAMHKYWSVHYGVAVPAQTSTSLLAIVKFTGSTKEYTYPLCTISKDVIHTARHTQRSNDERQLRMSAALEEVLLCLREVQIDERTLLVIVESESHTIDESSVQFSQPTLPTSNAHPPMPPRIQLQIPTKKKRYRARTPLACPTTRTTTTKDAKPKIVLQIGVRSKPQPRVKRAPQVKSVRKKKATTKNAAKTRKKRRRKQQ